MFQGLDRTQEKDIIISISLSEVEVGHMFYMAKISIQFKHFWQKSMATHKKNCTTKH